MRASDLLILLLIAMPLNAEELQDESGDLPSIELLEFLAEWETEDQQWLDPLEIEAMPLSNRSEGGDDNVAQ